MTTQFLHQPQLLHLVCHCWHGDELRDQYPTYQGYQVYL